MGLPAPQGSIYEVALTHRSFAFERLEQEDPLPHNERLEFLGDAVLQLIVTDLVWHTHPERPEGDLAKLRAAVVDKRSLATLAQDSGLGEHILLGKGEEATGGRMKPSLLADTFEALVGAAYLDRGLSAVAEVIVPVFKEMLEDAVAHGEGYDSKTALQEAVVRARATRPSYRVASSGPDHNKSFVAHVYVEEELFGVGSGSSTKEAEKAAAREALARLARLQAQSVDTSLRPVKEMRPDARAS
jgi:ribonuclease-3